MEGVEPVAKTITIAMLIAAGCILIGVTMPRVCDRLFDWHNMRQNRKLMDEAPLPPTQLDYESVRNAKEAASLLAQERENYDKLKPMVVPMRKEIDLFLGEP